MTRLTEPLQGCGEVSGEKRVLPTDVTARIGWRWLYVAFRVFLGKR